MTIEIKSNLGRNDWSFKGKMRNQREGMRGLEQNQESREITEVGGG